jgi:hypothetical protein
MKSLLRLACLAAVFPTAAFAAPSTAIDVYRELIRHRSAEVGAERALDYDTRGFVSMFLENPDSPYSELRDDPPISNELWWYDFVDSLAIRGDNASDAALDMLRWQGGFTKARPGMEVVVDAPAARAFRGREAAANAIKAGVDSDIFLKAWDMNGRMTTVGAGHAVALQLLRDEIRNHAPETYEARGILPDVLRRYLKLDSPQRLTQSDEAYLADLLRFAISDRSFTIDAQGKRQLPAAYRVARVAAAYADAAGYFNPKGYCRGNAPRMGEATGQDATEYDRPLCFIAATDRAVQAWFLRHMRREAALIRTAHGSFDETSRRVSLWFDTVLLLVDFAGLVEFGEAGLIDEMSAEGALAEEDAVFAEERANQLTCRIRP